LADPDGMKEYLNQLADDIANGTVSTNIKDTLKLDIPIESMYIDADGNIVVVNTNPDGSISETVLEAGNGKNGTDMVIVDKEGNIHETPVDANIARETDTVNYTEQKQDSTISEEETDAFKNKIIADLIRDIKKIDTGKYTGKEKEYIEGAINNTVYILNHTNIVSFKNYSATGWYEYGDIYATYTGNESEDDVKLTIFHEYLHHINYLYRLFPYRYSNENRREIYIKEDTCFYFGKETIQGIYDNFMLTLGTRLIEENWPDKYSDLEENQKQEVLRYKEQQKEQYDKEICIFGRYKPSNYYRDELSVYEICLTMDGVLFNISESKRSIYLDNKLGYENAMQLSVKYENNNNINEKGYEK
jgi:hypothetical protein